MKASDRTAGSEELRGGGRGSGGGDLWIVDTIQNKYNPDKFP